MSKAQWSCVSVCFKESVSWLRTCHCHLAALVAVLVRARQKNQATMSKSALWASLPEELALKIVEYKALHWDLVSLRRSGPRGTGPLEL